MASPFKEGQVLRWYADGSSWGQPSQRTAVAFRPPSETIWYNTGTKQSSQWEELRAIQLVVTNEPSPVEVCQLGSIQRLDPLDHRLTS